MGSVQEDSPKVAITPKSSKWKRASMSVMRKNDNSNPPFGGSRGPSVAMLEVWAATGAAASALVALKKSEREAARRSAAMKAVSSAGMHLFSVEGNKAKSGDDQRQEQDNDDESSVRSGTASLGSRAVSAGAGTGGGASPVKPKDQLKNKRLISVGQALWSDNRTVVSQGCASMWTLCR